MRPRTRVVRPLLPPAVWERVAPLFPAGGLPPGHDGLPAAFEPRFFRDRRAVLTGILLLLRDRRPWQGWLGPDLPSGRTCWEWWAFLQRAEAWPRIWEAIEAHHPDAGRLDRERALAPPTPETYLWGRPRPGDRPGEQAAQASADVLAGPPADGRRLALARGWRRPLPPDPPPLPPPPKPPPPVRPAGPAWSAEAQALVPDPLWDVLAPLRPAPPPRRRRKVPVGPLGDRRVLTGVAWVLTNSPTASWALLPKELGCGSPATARNLFWAWHRAGAWKRLLARLDTAPAPEWAGLPWLQALRPFAELPPDVGLKAGLPPRPAKRPGPAPAKPPRGPARDTARAPGPKKGGHRRARPPETYCGMSKALWDQLEGLLPPPSSAPDWLQLLYPAATTRRLLAGIVRVLADGLPWMGSLGKACPGASTCRAWLAWWNSTGAWGPACALLQANHPLAGQIDWARSFLLTPDRPPPTMAGVPGAGGAS